MLGAQLHKNKFREGYKFHQHEVYPVTAGLNSLRNKILPWIITERNSFQYVRELVSNQSQKKSNI